MKILIICVIAFCMYFLIGGIRFVYMWDEMTEVLNDCTDYEFYMSAISTIIVCTPYNLCKDIRELFKKEP